jgi:ribosomal protein S18 acetylase RimI-like enzyme
MKGAIEYHLNRAVEKEILEHLLCCDVDFVPPLSGRVALNDYAKKISSKAMRFEAWSDHTLVGLVAAYCNDPTKQVAYITNVSVLKVWTGEGIAFSLLQQCIAHATTLGMQQISLEVASDNVPAIKLYEKGGFTVGKVNAPFVTMDLYPNTLKNGKERDE